MADNFSDNDIQRLQESYQHFREPGFTNRRFKHKDILPLISRLRTHTSMELIQEGFSPEHREIFRIKMGIGDTTVLLWSQMHGNEPTATMAIFDLLRFFTTEGDGLDDIRADILGKLTIHIIPMLNPDGTERFLRRTAFGIDMNRDALQLRAPESQILKRVRDEINADFGFNLHDQSIHYSVGDTQKSAIIAFLSPPYNEVRSVNAVRLRSMQLIAQLNEMLQELIPGQVATYSDEYEPRAFGDNIQKWGTSTILIESGGLKGDPEKQYIRKLNYLLLLKSFLSIAHSAFKGYTVDQYESIPPNKLRLHSAIFRNITLPFKGNNFELDLAINRKELNSHGATAYYHRGIVSELGDLSTLNGIEEYDGTGLRAEPGLVYPDIFNGEKDLEIVDVSQLIRQGYTAIRMKNPPEGRWAKFPMNILGPDGKQPAGPSIGRAANLVFRRNGDIVYVVINGFVADAAGAVPEIGNAMVYR